MIIALDKDFQPIKPLLNTIVLLWDRRYYECGKFTVTMPMMDYSNDIAYVYHQNNVETGIVQSISTADNTIQLSGFFLEKLLDDYIVHPVFDFSGNIELCGRDMVSRYADDIPLLELGELTGLGTNIQLQETGMELGQRLYLLYQSQEMSYRLRYDYKQNKILFETYRGKDLTQGQDINPWVTFSRQRGNILDRSLLIDDSNHKNYAVIGGEGEGTDRKYVFIDKSNGEHKRKIFVDARDLQQGTKTDEEYNAELTLRGEEKLAEFKKIETLQFNLNDTESVKYKRDFDLGDKVDVVIADLGLEFATRITAVTETTKENRTTVSMVVGEMLPTIYKKIQMRR